MNLIGWLIIGCEIIFWVFIVFGLTVRYVFGKVKLGIIFLALTPVVDLVLLVATSIDLFNGAYATIVHGIAAIYIGVSIAFGKSMIRWADERFQYYITRTGSKPEPLYGLSHAKHNFKGSLRHVLSYLIGAGLLLIVHFMINNISRTDALISILKIWTLVLVIDLLISLSYFIWPRQNKKQNNQIKNV